MKLYQPVLFVGLGGTGCDVGAELERRLRDEVCGPDGNRFRHLILDSELLPYQLPSVFQFVYADMNQADLDRLPIRVVPGSEHSSAAARTAHYVNLATEADTFPELARNLRIQMMRATESWLPPAGGQPRVAPLLRGSGQFPTVGRAALFGTLIHNLTPAVSGLRTAIRSLSDSAEHMHALVGQPHFVP